MGSRGPHCVLGLIPPSTPTPVSKISQQNHPSPQNLHPASKQEEEISPAWHSGAQHGPGVTRGDSRTPATLSWLHPEAQEPWAALEQSLPITGIYTGGYLSTTANLGIIAALAAIGQRLLPQSGC